MKTYTFSGFLVAGSGRLSYLSDFVAADESHSFCSPSYIPCCTNICLEYQGVTGLFNVSVSCVYNLKGAIYSLRSFLGIESFDFYLNPMYKCEAGSKLSTRYFRNLSEVPYSFPR